MVMQYGHEYPAWTLDMETQYGYGDATYMGLMRPGHGHATWTWTCSLDMIKQPWTLRVYVYTYIYM
jgi:hypothetical protein